MMWCSYEALCEIGYASLPENDPSIIFGVIPQGLLHIPASMGGYSGHDLSQTRVRTHVPEDHVPMSNVRTTSNSTTAAAASATIQESPFSINHSPIITEDDTTMQHLDHVSMMGAAGRLSFGATPLQTPHGYIDTHSIQRNQNNPESSQRQSSIIRGTTLFQAPPSRRKSELVSTALFSTPATPQQTSRVIDRAKKIAGRRYYEPSPETTPPNAMRIVALPPTSIKTAKKKYRRSFVGMGYDESSSNISAYHEKRDEHKGRLLFESMEQYGDVVVESTRMDTTLDLSAVKSTKKSFVPKLSPPRRQQKESTLTAEETKIDRTSSLRTFDTDSDEGVKFVLDLLATLGAAQRMICSFKCKEALQIFHTLPHSQFQTGWVQHQVGRAYLALPDYTNAQRALETMQQLEPHRMKGLELLSTTLYLLKKEVELSNLSQRAVNFDQMSPETWCVVGNFFSLQKEHKSALTFFHRAIQLDPNFTYAHTLYGHEFVANEDFDQAIAAYRDAIRVDDRHYNAWNGLGEIYFKQEKYDIAEYHFQKGLSINPQSSVIRCHLSQTQQAKGNLHLALDTLAMVDERNPQAKYQRANILLALDRCEEALLEMEKVRDASPRESSVYITMGRIYKRLGKTDEAMKAFLCALDFDPKENNSIKAAIDRIDEPELDEDLSAF
jgi:anaphase-promoting complex subunit 3